MAENIWTEYDNLDGHFLKQPIVETSNYTVPVELTEEDILEAIAYGFQIQNTTEFMLNYSSHHTGEHSDSRRARTHSKPASLHFNFHAPTSDSMLQACVGNGFVKATKFLQEKYFADLETHRLADIFGQIETDNEMCMMLTKDICMIKLYNESEHQCASESPYRTYDGYCNNLEHPFWGTSSSALTRFLEPAYGDGVNSLRGSDLLSNMSLPSPRKVSVELQNTTERPDLTHVNMMVMQFGQFLTHDLGLTPESAAKENGTAVPLACCVNGVQRNLETMDDCQPIDTSDDSFHQLHGSDCMRFVRSITANKGCTFGAREQVNQQTSFIDASMLYGATEKAAMALRTFEGGKFKVTYMGGNKFDYLPKKTKCKRKFNVCSASGDGRVDEAAGLTSIHTVLHRLHNTIVAGLADINPNWGDEALYQEGRHIVAALMQQITFREYLPLLIGPKVMKMFHLEVQDDGYMDDYNNGCNPSVANAFSTAAFRFGHSMIKENFRSGDDDIPLQGNFFNISNFLSGKTCPSRILAGLIEEVPAGNDVFLTPTVSQRMFAPFGAPAGLDLMAINIQRGRDHGLPGYLEWRRACKLSIPTDFDDLSDVMNEEYARAFKKIYKKVGDIDLFPAGLAEYPMEDALVGPTFACIIGQQFQNTKMGDRFWYESSQQPKPFSPAQLSALRNVSFSTILCVCSGIQQLQPKAFVSYHLAGNSLKPCETYEPLDLAPWKE